jgi:hypothetical protein
MLCIKPNATGQVTTIHTFLILCKPAMKVQSQTIADIICETKISSDRKTCDFSNIQKIFGALKLL